MDAGNGADGLPDPKTGPVGGKAETEKHGYASELVAYRMIDNLAVVIANRVDTILTNLRQKDGAGLLMVEDIDQAVGRLEFAEVGGQTELLDSVFADLEQKQEELLSSDVADERKEARARMRNLKVAGLLPPFASSALMLLPEPPKAVGLVADVLGYFRSNHKISGREVSVSERTLRCSAVGLLKQRGLTVFPVLTHPVRRRDSTNLRRIFSTSLETSRKRRRA